MNDSTPTLTLEELLERTNRELRRWLPEGTPAAPFTERTLRYYVSQGLLPKLGTRGPGARYPESFLWRLLFIRRLQRERSLTLEQVRQAMERVTPETMARVVRGEDGLEIARPADLDADALRSRVETGEEIVPLTATDELMAHRESRGPASPDDAADYLARMRHRFGPSASRVPRSRGTEQTPWQPVWRDGRAEIRIQGELTDAQRRQIENLGALLKSILED
jgi:DNA-binding transcriptional MerR regulator